MLLKKIFYFALTFVFAGLAGLGALIPGLLPSTPFVVAAGVCAARSSERLHRMILSWKWAGSILQNWERDRSITYKNKVLAVVGIWIGMVVFSQKLIAGIDVWIWWDVHIMTITASVSNAGHVCTALGAVLCKHVCSFPTASTNK